MSEGYNFGNRKCVLLGPATTQTGYFSAAYALRASRISAMTAGLMDGSTLMTSATTVPAGAWFGGGITSISVQAGAVIVYE